MEEIFVAELENIHYFVLHVHKDRRNKLRNEEIVKKFVDGKVQQFLQSS